MAMIVLVVVVLMVLVVVMVNAVIGMEVDAVVCRRCEVILETLNVGKGKLFITKMLRYTLKGDTVFILTRDSYVPKYKKTKL